MLTDKRAHKNIKFNKRAYSRFKTDPVTSKAHQNMVIRAGQIYEDFQALKTFHQGFYKLDQTKCSKYNYLNKTNRFLFSDINLTNKRTNSQFKQRVKTELINSKQQDYQKLSDSSKKKGKPLSLLNLKQLLKLKSQHQDKQSSQINKNPFYKIQKQRLISHHSSRNPSSCISSAKTVKKCINYQAKPIQQFQKALSTDVLENSDQVLISKYSKQINNSGIRKKSHTKIYQEIKQYFQAKYSNQAN